MIPRVSRQPARPSLRIIPCANRRRLIWRTRPLVMGILNVTPDSFSDGGRFLDPTRAVAQGLRLEAEGADLLDVGGESTRPGAPPVPLDEELRRVIPVIARLAKAARVPLSIDTSKAEVARRALEAGAAVVNDVTALRGDPRMAGVAAQSRAAVILMHMRGTPRTMQCRPRYRDVVGEVAAFLRQAVARAEAAGIERPRILVDPGLGFGKTVTHTLLLLRGLDRLAALGFPVVVGPSRKSFIGAVLVAPPARRDTSSPAWAERLNGTLACVAASQRTGAAIVRVHDVKPAVQLLTMLEAIETPDAARRQH
jgi:dihydropteroate synthase